ncbi:hypothetical protein GIB67_037283 [Kingdonia uniflora]|uniref:BAHD acyltransferase n=1 Tax=Kingdonia uniflora TaxID=39325 RepID=A0A7J7MSG6_9MAGN|nr:hypothetical protein GIB67_037283 [Kingdonia uniflora]
MVVENGSEKRAMKVKMINKTTVLPNKKLGRQECPLVTFDLPYVTFYYNQKLLLYKGDDFEEKVAKLKEGLGVVLKEFYPLAGRLGKDEEGVLRVVCDNENIGVEVVEAIAEEVTVADLAEDEIPRSDFQEIVPYTGIMNLEGLHRPLLAVQLTKLKDGLAIGCAFNHAVLDGNSTWHFMTSWSEICCGATEVSVQPFHDRTKARGTRVKLDLPELTTNEDMVKANGDAKLGPQLREKIFRFSESAIDKIKSVVNSKVSNGTKPYSTFQSLGVHIWRAVSRARHLKPKDITVFTIFIDCRKRVEPPMPDNYFGNLIQAVFTVTAAGLLLGNPPEFGASMLQKVIESHDWKAIDERSKQWESAPMLFQFKDAGINCVAVGSSPRFEIYNVDFGWGKPETVRSGSNNKFDGMVYLYRGKDGGRRVDVEMTLEANAMEILEKDEEFLLVV